MYSSKKNEFTIVVAVDDIIPAAL